MLLTHGTATGREEGRALLKSIGRAGDVQGLAALGQPGGGASIFQ